MKIALTTLADRPYFWIYDQLADWYAWFANAAHLLISSYGIGKLVICLLLLIVLLRLRQEASA